MKAAGRRAGLARLCGIAAAAVLAGAGPAAACDPRLSLAYEDESPEDTLTILNQSERRWALVALSIDLSAAKGDVIFDTASGGPGYSMYTAINGADLAAPSVLEDGAKRAELALKPIPPGGRSILFLDLDDAWSGGGTYVSGAAIAGARVSAEFRDPEGRKEIAVGRFGDDGEAALTPLACV